MLAKRLITLIFSIILTFSMAGAAGLEEFFNTTNHVFYNGTDIVIGNVRVGNAFYWGDWKLQNDLSFRLVNYGTVNDGHYIDLERLNESKGAVEVSRSEVESLGFIDLEGCVRFSKRPDLGYVLLRRGKFP